MRLGKIALVSCFVVLGLVACGTDTSGTGVALQDSRTDDTSYVEPPSYSPPAELEPEPPTVAPEHEPEPPAPAPKPPRKKRAPAPAPEPEPECHSSYRGACLKPDASDYDCAGGSGNGPYYVQGPVRVVGPDEYDLDRDGDGIGCDS
jgi:hypothetical protein